MLVAAAPAGDPEERKYRYNIKTSLKRKDIVEDKTGVRAKDAMTQDLADSLMRAGGPLSAGTMPAVRGVQERGMTSLAEAMASKAPIAKLPPKDAKPRPKAEALKGAAKLDQTAPLQKAEAWMYDMLNSAKQARAYALSLHGHELSENLVAKMSRHAVLLEDTFAKMQQVVMKGRNTEGAYTHFYAATAEPNLAKISCFPGLSLHSVNFWAPKPLQHNAIHHGAAHARILSRIP